MEVEKIRYPHVYDSQAEARETSAFIAGAKVCHCNITTFGNRYFLRKCLHRYFLVSLTILSLDTICGIICENNRKNGVLQYIFWVPEIYLNMFCILANLNMFSIQKIFTFFWLFQFVFMNCIHCFIDWLNLDCYIFFWLWENICAQEYCVASVYFQFITLLCSVYHEIPDFLMFVGIVHVYFSLI